MLFEWTRIIKIVKTTYIQHGKQHVRQKSGHFVFQDGGRFWCIEGCPHFLYENIQKELSVCQILCFYKKVNNFDVFCPLAAPLYRGRDGARLEMCMLPYKWKINCLLGFVCNKLNELFFKSEKIIWLITYLSPAAGVFNW